MLGTRESRSSDFWERYPSDIPNNGETVAALVHGLGIVRLLALHRGGLSLSEVAERTGLAKTSALRLLSTLTLTGYVRQKPGTKLYVADYAVLEVAGFLLRGIEARWKATPYLYDLAGRTGFSVVMSVLRDDVVVVIEKVASRPRQGRPSEIGFRIPAHASSPGKVLLAHLPEPELEAFLSGTSLRGCTERTIVDPAALRAHLAEVRQQGYAINDGEWVSRVRSIGGPIRNYRGDVIAAVGVTSHDLLPEGIATELGDLLRHVPALLEATEAISYSLGYHAEVLV